MSRQRAGDMVDDVSVEAEPDDWHDWYDTKPDYIKPRLEAAFHAGALHEAIRLWAYEKVEAAAGALLALDSLDAAVIAEGGLGVNAFDSVPARTWERAGVSLKRRSLLRLRCIDAELAALGGARGRAAGRRLRRRR